VRASLARASRELPTVEMGRLDSTLGGLMDGIAQRQGPRLERRTQEGCGSPGVFCSF
jgi:hypothetical protein